MPIGCREVHHLSHELALVRSELEQEMTEFRAADGTHTFPDGLPVVLGQQRVGRALAGAG